MSAPTVSGGWREEYAHQEAPTSFFDSSARERSAEPDGEPQPDLTQTMDTTDCPFCSWTGPANSFPAHVPECPGKDSGEPADAGRERPPKRTTRATAGGGK